MITSVPKGPKQPTGTFDNTGTCRREYWYDGKLQHSYSAEFIDSECARNYAYGKTVHPWGHFKDLP